MKSVTNKLLALWVFCGLGVAIPSALCQTIDFVDIQVNAPAPMSGPLQGISVFLVDANDYSIVIDESQTDSGGYASFTNVPEGVRALIKPSESLNAPSAGVNAGQFKDRELLEVLDSSHPGYLASVNTQISTSETLELSYWRVRGTVNASIIGQPTSNTGELEGIDVTITDGEKFYAVARTDANGVYTIALDGNLSGAVAENTELFLSASDTDQDRVLDFYKDFFPQPQALALPPSITVQSFGMISQNATLNFSLKESDGTTPYEVPDAGGGESDSVIECQLSDYPDNVPSGFIPPGITRTVDVGATMGSLPLAGLGTDTTEYECYFEGEGFTSQRVELQIASGQTLSADFVVNPTIDVSFEIVDENGLVVGDANFDIIVEPVNPSLTPEGEFWEGSQTETPSLPLVVGEDYEVEIEVPFEPTMSGDPQSLKRMNKKVYFPTQEVTFTAGTDTANGQTNLVRIPVQSAKSFIEISALDPDGQQLTRGFGLVLCDPPAGTVDEDDSEGIIDEYVFGESVDPATGVALVAVPTGIGPCEVEFFAPPSIAKDLVKGVNFEIDLTQEGTFQAQVQLARSDFDLKIAANFDDGEPESLGFSVCSAHSPYGLYAFQDNEAPAFEPPTVGDDDDDAPNNSGPGTGPGSGPGSGPGQGPGGNPPPPATTSFNLGLIASKSTIASLVGSQVSENNWVIECHVEATKGGNNVLYLSDPIVYSPTEGQTSGTATVNFVNQGTFLDDEIEFQASKDFTYVASDGLTRVYIPANTFSASGTLTLSLESVSSFRQFERQRAGSIPIDITVLSGSDEDAEELQPTTGKWLELTFVIPAKRLQSLGVDGKDAFARFYDGDQGIWLNTGVTPQSVTLGTDGQATVTIRTTHLSTWGGLLDIAKEKAATLLSNYSRSIVTAKKKRNTARKLKIELTCDAGDTEDQTLFNFRVARLNASKKKKKAQLADDEVLFASAKESGSVIGCAHTFKLPRNSSGKTTYYWQVRADDGGEWSEKQKFKLKARK